MLQASMQMVMLASQPGIDPGLYLSRMAERHSRKDLDIPPQLYEYWLEALLQTVEEKDPEYTAEVREVWNLIMESGIQYMCSRYED
ncbi:MAG: hypothetical protein O3A95_06765 [Planctomycetota bacterium]|nr:hypothetical protein [Planctomycetota bacterium]MDA1113984.1 hypothetical protein [Planctomycetota bacterium]